MIHLLAFQMPTPIFELVPWWMVVVSFFFASVGGWGFWRWRNSSPGDRARHTLRLYSARDVFITYSLIAVVVLCVTVEIVLRRRQGLQDLAQFVTPYPGAVPQLALLKHHEGMWMLETPDSPEKVRAFYSGVADSEKVPFRQVRDSDARFVFGQGTNAVAVDIDDESGPTTIMYHVPAGPQAF